MSHESSSISPGDSASQAGLSQRNRDDVAAQLAAATVKLELEQERHQIEIEELQLRHRRELLELKAKVAEHKYLLNPNSVNSDSDIVFRASHLNEFVPNTNCVAALGSPSHVVNNMTTITSDNNILSIVKQNQMQNNAMVENLKLPAVQISPFSGDPLQYWPFIRSFESTVGQSSVDDASKLTRLVNYCNGTAHRVIECCMVMNPAEGYKRAKQLLKDRFGNEYIILQCWLKRITGPSKVSDKVQIQQLADDLVCCQETLEAMNACTEINNQTTLLRIIDRLPPYLQNRWKVAVRKLRINQRWPSIGDVVKFVTDAALEANDPIYSALSTNSGRRPDVSYAAANKTRHPAIAAAASSDVSFSSLTTNNDARKPRSCIVCQADHPLYKCRRFEQMDIDQRYAVVRDNKLCFNCLVAGHRSDRCRLNKVCHVCKVKHSTLLHRAAKTSPTSLNTEVKTVEIVNNSCSMDDSKSRCVFQAGLPIVPVMVGNPTTKFKVKTYALLDTGSTNSFCDKELVRQLDLNEVPEVLSITTLTATNSRCNTSIVELEVSNIDGESTSELTGVYVRETLSMNNGHKANNLDIANWPHLQDIHLVELEAARVGLLIGQDFPDLLMPLEVRRGLPGEPFAARTILGWTINGPTKPRHAAGLLNNFVKATNDDLRNQVELFWKAEDVPAKSLPLSLDLSVDDKRVIKVWEKSICYLDGHYSLDIPFKVNPPNLSNNRIMAEQRLRGLRRRLLNDAELHVAYTSNMIDLLIKGYAEPVDSTLDEQQNRVWYLPHHPVFNVNKPGKLRIVFDCAAPFNGISLNNVASQGPDLTNKLLGVLLRFRLHRVAIMADIESMFHQVKVNIHHRDYLRFLWWPGGDLNCEPQVCRMTSHLFGGVWSPSCCNFALKMTAHAAEHNYDTSIIQCVESNFYVDDFLKSVPTKEQAVYIVSELSSLLKTGGFHLTKWISNSSDVLSSIPENDRSSNQCFTLADDNSIQRALGVKWAISDDKFIFQVCDRDRPPTKRGILSSINSVYDPLGLICPFVLPAKRLLQELCRNGIGWDDSLPSPQVETWLAWKADQSVLLKLRIERCIGRYIPSGLPIQIHHFCDASLYGYGTASYLRTVNNAGNVNVTLIMAKSRLAPMKPTLTIPRLELSAAVLAAKMNETIETELGIGNSESFYWSDSTIVLQYLFNQDKRFQTFVANRVATILELSKPEQWHHVPSSDNPADHASRGLRAEKLLNNNLWFNGPEFLKHEMDKWPKCPIIIHNEPDSNLEIRKEPVIYTTMSDEAPVDDIFDKIFKRRSNFLALKKDVAWLLRLRLYLRYKASHNVPVPDMTQPLTVTEMKSAENEIVRLVQVKSFPLEMTAQVDEVGNCKISKSSHLLKLDPIKLNDGLLRVGGRLDIHPIILPKKHVVVELIVRYCHVNNGHVGQEHVLALTRQNYWIISPRSIIRRVIKNCSACRLRRPIPQSQKMANLPSDRITPGDPPFTYTGVDVFGPFVIKRGRTEVKRYGCLFTCLVIRAIHIEVLHTMETDSFLQALQRFTCRRGQVRVMRSDNGTNFVGAANELKAGLNNNKVAEFLRNRNIEWRFNTPAASHMGGVWERQIRSVRKILSAVLREQNILDDEGLSTLLCLVESIINSRPITTVSDDHRDVEALTPNHLLLLKQPSNLHQDEFDKSDNYSRKRWRRVQYMADVFWRRWTTEYLPTLSVRRRWPQQSRNLREGDVVVMMDEKRPRNSWSLARVVETYPSEDGLVRSVKIITSTAEGQATLVRPIHKLGLIEAVANLTTVS